MKGNSLKLNRNKRRTNKYTSTHTYVVNAINNKTSFLVFVYTMYIKAHTIEERIIDYFR